eukprot:956774_1
MIWYTTDNHVLYNGNDATKNSWHLYMTQRKKIKRHEHIMSCMWVILSTFIDSIELTPGFIVYVVLHSIRLHFGNKPTKLMKSMNQQRKQNRNGCKYMDEYEGNTITCGSHKAIEGAVLHTIRH